MRSLRAGRSEARTGHPEGHLITGRGLGGVHKETLRRARVTPDNRGSTPLWVTRGSTPDPSGRRVTSGSSPETHVVPSGVVTLRLVRDVVDRPQSV